MHHRVWPILILVGILASAAPQAAAQEPKEEDPYYVRADVHAARAPGAYSPEDDCAQAAWGYPDGELIWWTLYHVRPIIDPAHPSIGGWLPDCVAAGAPPTPPCLPSGTGCGGWELLHGHVAYEISSGDYAVVVGSSALGAAGSFSWAMVGVSGNSGIGIEFDCQGCPPPGVQ